MLGEGGPKRRVFHFQVPGPHPPCNRSGLHLRHQLMVENEDGSTHKVRSDVCSDAWLVKCVHVGIAPIQHPIQLEDIAV